MIDTPYSVTFLIGTPIFEWYVVWCAPRMDTGKTCVYMKLLCMLNI